MEGSPPRGRGKVVTPTAIVIPMRITPAWAGKSPPRHGKSRTIGDHPRVGGEKPIRLLPKV